MNKKSSSKKADADKNVKRVKTEPKETKVNGSAKFENGKLVTPEPKTTTEQLMEMQKKKEQLKAQEPATLDEAKELIEKLRAKLKGTRAPKLEDLPDEESPIKYFNFCQVQKYRDELKYILAEVEKIPDIEIRHNAYCECYRIHGMLVGEIYPLKRQYSGRINPGVVKRWDTPDSYLEALKAQVEKVRAAKAEEPKPAPVKTGNASKKVESVDVIKKRIEKLSNGHNAIHIKNITAEIKQYADAEGYHFVDDGHTMVVRGL